MKKIILIAAMVLGFAVAADAQGFRLGARLGSGFQAQAEYSYNGANYFEGRLGLAWYIAGEPTADFTILHNWNVCTMDWTPSVGQWFFDAGVGLTVGGRAYKSEAFAEVGGEVSTIAVRGGYVNLGVAACAKLGIEFNNAPVRLSLDFTPAFGPEIAYISGYGAGAGFAKYGLANLGISAVYCF